MDSTDTFVASLSTQLTIADRTAITSRYQILKEVGRGGMGVVYKAKQLALNRDVAVKVCLDKGNAVRFRREGELAARVRSPFVVAVHDLEPLSDGSVLLVMEWVEGTNLAALMKESGGAVAEARVASWMRQVCQGMQSAADHGVVHRDLKPSNIIINRQDVAQVADFGLARAHGLDELTLAGGMMGTPYYMAPEQAEDPRGADTRSDVYSFGATFYHVLTGLPPFRGETSFSVMFKHKTEPLVAPQAWNPSLTPRLGECLERCLAKSPYERFQSFNDMLAHLQSDESGADAWANSDGPEVERHLERYRARRTAYLGEAPLGAGDVYSLPNGRTLRIGSGNLVEQRVDALVSSDDEMLSMGGGVSAALRRSAGPTYYADAQHLVPVRHGRAVVTPAGSLPARFVFHAVTIAARDQARPSRDIVNELLESCFYHADTLGVKSIAFPLLGAGVGRLSREVCLDTMVRFLVRKFARGATTVLEARIIIY